MIQKAGCVKVIVIVWLVAPRIFYVQTYLDDDPKVNDVSTYTVCRYVT